MPGGDAVGGFDDLLGQAHEVVDNGLDIACTSEWPPALTLARPPAQADLTEVGLIASAVRAS